MTKVICRNCDYKHSASHRETSSENDVGYCPSCGSVRAKYVEGETTAEQIRTELEETDGVHPTIIKRIEEKYDSLVELEKVSIEELKDIKGIGEKLAKRIHNSG